jgi:hypothetical protein
VGDQYFNELISNYTTIHKFTMKTREMALASARILMLKSPSHLIFFACFAFLLRVVQITLFSLTYYEH